MPSASRGRAARRRVSVCSMRSASPGRRVPACGAAPRWRLVLDVPRRGSTPPYCGAQLGDAERRPSGLKSRGTEAAGVLLGSASVAGRSSVTGSGVRRARKLGPSYSGTGATPGVA